jgi:hypothetical protein
LNFFFCDLGEDGALTSVMLQMKFGMVGSALLPTCTYASTVRSSYLTSILGNSMFTLQTRSFHQCVIITGKMFSICCFKT